jgi:hypothetical protein
MIKFIKTLLRDDVNTRKLTHLLWCKQALSFAINLKSLIQEQSLSSSTNFA